MAQRLAVAPAIAALAATAAGCAFDSPVVVRFSRHVACRGDRVPRAGADSAPRPRKDDPRRPDRAHRLLDHDLVRRRGSDRDGGADADLRRPSPHPTAQARNDVRAGLHGTGDRGAPSGCLRRASEVDRRIRRGGAAAGAGPRGLRSARVREAAAGGVTDAARRATTRSSSPSTCPRLMRSARRRSSPLRSRAASPDTCSPSCRRSRAWHGCAPSRSGRRRTRSPSRSRAPRPESPPPRMRRERSRVVRRAGCRRRRSRRPSRRRRRS
jgi:hypothetical protein